jgi:uncharacterized protein (DUF736 family)
MSERDPNEIGALWLKTSPKGQPYMSGKIDGKAVVIFKNKKKTNEKHPDYRVLLSKPRENRKNHHRLCERFARVHL